MMDVLTSETCWALNNEIIKQVTSSWSLFIHTHTHTHIYIYIYIFRLFIVSFMFKNVIFSETDKMEIMKNIWNLNDTSLSQTCSLSLVPFAARIFYGILSKSTSPFFFSVTFYSFTTAIQHTSIHLKFYYRTELTRFTTTWPTTDMYTFFPKATDNTKTHCLTHELCNL